MVQTKSGRDITVSKTVSMPLGIFNAIQDEATVMGCNFSEATTRLVRIAISVRKDGRKGGL